MGPSLAFGSLEKPWHMQAFDSRNPRERRQEARARISTIRDSVLFVAAISIVDG